MNMNKFQRITCAAHLKMAKKAKVELGIGCLDDHLEEAADAYAKMDGAADRAAYMEGREKLMKMLGFMLADIALVCDGLSETMDNVAVENLIDLINAGGAEDE